MIKQTKREDDFTIGGHSNDSGFSRDSDLDRQ